MLELWMFYVIISLIAALIEAFIPTFFSINFAFASIITALISIFWGDLTSTLVIFIITSIISLIFVKPILLKNFKMSSNSDFTAQYIGKIVKTIEPISSSQGAITIYDERWEARTKDDTIIDSNNDVKIVDNDGLILFVEQVDKYN